MLFTAFVLSLSMMASAEAKTVQVTALEDFNTANPPQVLHVQMNANTRLDYDLMLFQGFQVTGKVQAREGAHTIAMAPKIQNAYLQPPGPSCAR